MGMVVEGVRGSAGCSLNISLAAIFRSATMLSGFGASSTGGAVSSGAAA
jgi:hypothetical protein